MSAKVLNTSNFRNFEIWT